MLRCSAQGWAQAEARQPIPIQFSFDRPIDASALPSVLASAGGLFSAEGLAVTTNIASGSPEAIARVASGASDFALVDINELIRFRGKPDAPPVKAVFVLFNQSPYAIIARKSRGIHALSDIEGKTLGVADGDLSIRLWPALARQNGIKIAGVKQSRISAAVREPMLSAGQVDAVTGIFLPVGGQSEGSRRAGRRPRGASICRLWLRGLRFCRHRQSGVRRRKPRGREGLRARADCRDASRHQAARPARWTKSSAGWMADRAIWSSNGCSTLISDNILTGEVRRNGLGGVDPARLDRSIDQSRAWISNSANGRPRRIFSTIRFLPPLDGRLIN